VDNFQTIEVRWFYPGVLPDQVGKWFNTLGEPLEKIDTRSDFYLQSNSPDLGVKLRQGNLEVKYRQQDLGTIAIDGLENSQVEQWSKWICVDDSSGLTPTKIAGKPGWLKVDKIRDRRLYRVDVTDTVKLTQTANPTADIAAIEITQLQLQSQIWWTIACEYFGDNISIDQFGSLVRSLRAGYPSSTSPLPISCGYPQWLSQSN
jgi:hypothetical protein